MNLTKVAIHHEGNGCYFCDITIICTIPSQHIYSFKGQYEVE